MIDSNKFKEIKKCCLIERNDVIGIGVVPTKKEYTRVRINIDYLQKALDILKKYTFEDNAIVILVKHNGVIQIGKDDIGVLIAPIIDDDDRDKLRGCDDNE